MILNDVGHLLIDREIVVSSSLHMATVNNYGHEGWILVRSDYLHVRLRSF